MDDDSLGRFAGYGPLQVLVREAPDSAEWQVAIRTTNPETGQTMDCLAPVPTALEMGTAIMGAASVAHLRNLGRHDEADAVAEALAL